MDSFRFLATLVALHFTPVSESVSGSAEFRTSVAPRLASLFFQMCLQLSMYFFGFSPLHCLLWNSSKKWLLKGNHSHTGSDRLRKNTFLYFLRRTHSHDISAIFGQLYSSGCLWLQVHIRGTEDREDKHQLLIAVHCLTVPSILRWGEAGERR